jgi:hypothetical protein
MSTRRMLKYQISCNTSQQADVLMPAHAVIRAVGMQNERIYAWAETDGVGGAVTRTFCVVPTGGNVPYAGSYLGTVFEGPFVWHMYEVLKP